MPNAATTTKPRRGRGADNPKRERRCCSLSSSQELRAFRANMDTQLAKEMRQLKQSDGKGTAKSAADYKMEEVEEEQKFVTWEQVMAVLRDRNMPDSQCAEEVKEWYRGVLTSTKEDRQGKGIDYSDNFGWTMMFMATYYDKPFTVLELL